MVCLLLTSAVGLISSSAATSPVPVVYICGQGTDIFTESNNIKSEKCYPLEIPDGYIAEAAKKLVGLLTKAIVTDKWDEYCDGLYEAVLPFCEKLALDKNSEASNGSGNV